MQATDTESRRVEPPQAEADTDGRALAAALLGAAWLSGCGGAGELPEAFSLAAAAPLRRHILGAGTAAAAASGPVPTAAELMDWAERVYPQYFAPHQVDRFEAPFTFRLYPDAGNSLGVADGMVYVLGPVAGSDSVPVAVGTLADFAPQVLATRYAYTDAQAARFLNQATLGATDADIAAVRSLGYEAWLAQQFAQPPSSGNWDWLVAKGIDADPNARAIAIGVDAQVWQRLIAAPDSLRQRVALALSEIFVVGFDGITGVYKQFKLAAYWDLLASHAFGDYRTLLEAVTLSPAMGNYLNTAGNQKEDPASGRLPDENYAREVMQLFSIGLVELHADGTPKLDAQGRPVETYTQDTVTQLARVFTGWSYDVRRGDTSPEQTRRALVLNPALHSTQAARFLGTTVLALTDGVTALRMALDTLAAHPNVGPFIGRQLIQRLVTSNPSAAYVGRVAAAFADNGAGRRGDFRAVLRAVLLDEEARGDSGLADPDFGKLREPVVRFVQWARAFKASSASGDWLIGNLGDPSRRLGQSPQRSPSVFNFFRPGYLPAGTALAADGLVAPEFQLANETSVAGYLNFMLGVTAGQHADLKPDYRDELALAGDAAALVARVERLLCAGQLQTDARSLIVDAVGSISINAASGAANRVATAVMLVMSAPDYLVQR